MEHESQLDDDRSPDFVHAIMARRYTWVALVLALPAGIFAALSFVLPVLIMAAFAGAELLMFLGIVLSIAGTVVLWCWINKRRGRRPPRRSEPPLYPNDTEGLLELGDCLIAELERGDDRGYKWYLHYFVGALDRLSPEVRAELRRWGADLARLRASLYSPTDSPREPATARRALHGALQGFVTAVRQPDGQVPYRSTSSDSSLQNPEESGVEAEIRETLRSRLIGTGLIVVVVWIVLTGSYLIAAEGDSFAIAKFAGDRARNDAAAHARRRPFHAPGRRSLLDRSAHGSVCERGPTLAETRGRDVADLASRAGLDCVRDGDVCGCLIERTRVENMDRRIAHLSSGHHSRHAHAPG